MTARENTRLIVVHCSATRPSQQIGAAEIDEWHRARGFAQIGYHAVIRRTGRLEFGRPFGEVGAHVLGHNRSSVGVCLVGGLLEDGTPGHTFAEVYTGRQRETLLNLLHVLWDAYPDAQTVGHRDLSPDIDGDGIVEPWEWLKDCPCFDVAAEFGV